MHRYVALCIGLLLLVSGIALADEALTLLEKSDSSYFPPEAKLKMRLEDYEKDQLKRYYESEVYVKGSDRYLLVGIEPAVLRGRTQLRIRDTIYYFLKKIDKVNQVSAKVAFYSSTLSQEDMMNSKLSTFYNLESYTVQENNMKSLYVLNLVAKSKEVAYYRVICFVESGSLLPVKREYYAFSGQKVREMFFEDIQFKDGKLALLKFTMYDSLRKGVYTKVVMSDFDYTKPVPDTYFTKAYMKIAAK